jgi:hypothetical protein
MVRATNERPTRRRVSSRLGQEYVVELRAETIAIRLKGARRGGPMEVFVTPGAVFIRALQARVDKEKAEKRKARNNKKRVR